jgi:hypothetical protein
MAKRQRKPTDRECRSAVTGMEYSAWAGACLDEAILANPGLCDDRKRELLKLCPPTRKREGRKLLEMLPQIARALDQSPKRKAGSR